MVPESSEAIARDIARDKGNEDWWHYLHPLVKWTIRWLGDRGFLLIVERDETHHV